MGKYKICKKKPKNHTHLWNNNYAKINQVKPYEKNLAQTFGQMWLELTTIHMICDPEKVSAIKARVGCTSCIANDWCGLKDISWLATFSLLQLCSSRRCHDRDSILIWAIGENSNCIRVYGPKQRVLESIRAKSPLA